MKVYTTKYALTTGIGIEEVKDADDDGYVYTKMGLGFQQFKLGRDAFHTYEEAAMAARAMRDKKRGSLLKQLDKLNALIFPTEMPENLK